MNIVQVVLFGIEDVHHRSGLLPRIRLGRWRVLLLRRERYAGGKHATKAILRTVDLQLWHDCASVAMRPAGREYGFWMSSDVAASMSVWAAEMRDRCGGFVCGAFYGGGSTFGR